MSSMDEKNDIQQIRDDLTQARQGENTVQIISSLRKLGQLYLERGDAPQALTQFNEALKLVADTEDHIAHAQVLGFRGLALKMIGNFSLALQSFRKSNAVAKSIGQRTIPILGMGSEKSTQNINLCITIFNGRGDFQGMLILSNGGLDFSFQ